MHNEPTQDPENAARELFAAVEERRIHDIADFVHPIAAETLKAVAISEAEFEEKNFEARRALYEDPNRIRSPYDEPAYRRHFDVVSVAELSALSSRELIVRAIEYSFRNTEPAESGQRIGVSAASFSVGWEVLGHTAEPPDRAHVVYRVTTIRGGKEFTNVMTLTLRLHNRKWLSEALYFMSPYGSWEGYPPA